MPSKHQMAVSEASNILARRSVGDHQQPERTRNDMMRKWWKDLRKDLLQVVFFSALVAVVFAFGVWSCHLKDRGVNVEFEDVMFGVKVFIAWFAISTLLYFPRDYQTIQANK